MTDNKIKESIQIAEEVAKEICSGKPSTSAMLEQWKQQSPVVNEELRKQEHLLREISFHDSVDVEASLRKINKRIATASPSSSRRFITRTIGIAASFLLVVGSVTWWMWSQAHEQNRRVAETSLSGNASNSLTIQNNQTTATLEINEKNLAVQGNQLIACSSDGKKQVTIELNRDNQFNKLTVPRGGSYQLTLEDGTVVQVNTDSELLFPTHFDRRMRQVRLRGEAHFNVKSNKEHPFYVLFGDLNVQATGTTFNVKAYEEDEETCVTLLEGEVHVRQGQQLLATLAPGQSFTYRKATREHQVTEANLSAVAGWTYGKFIFYNETIGHIMRELSRWYGVDIRVDDPVKELRYSGVLLRERPLTEILSAISLTNELDFKFHSSKKIDTVERAK